MVAKASHPFEILLVEDNPADVELMRVALQENRIKRNLRVARDGEEAMELLKETGEAGRSERPQVIFLDLNLPRKDGREVLSEIKADARLRRIPVIVLSSSAAAEDIDTAYDLQANCYITKPMNASGYFDVVAAMDRFWFSVVQLPS